MQNTIMLYPLQCFENHRPVAYVPLRVFDHHHAFFSLLETNPAPFIELLNNTEKLEAMLENPFSSIPSIAHPGLFLRYLSHESMRIYLAHFIGMLDISPAFIQSFPLAKRLKNAYREVILLKSSMDEFFFQACGKEDTLPYVFSLKKIVSGLSALPLHNLHALVRAEYEKSKKLSDVANDCEKYSPLLQ